MYWATKAAASRIKDAAAPRLQLSWQRADCPPSCLPEALLLAEAGDESTGRKHDRDGRVTGTSSRHALGAGPTGDTGSAGPTAAAALVANGR
jgi:hypothetical protein